MVFVELTDGRQIGFPAARCSIVVFNDYLSSANQDIRKYLLLGLREKSNETIH